MRCIADGEVVAYRLNADYLDSQFEQDASCLQLKYSTSFCLVRHTYQSPPNPEEGPDHGKQNSLTFYSLYMHLLPFERYPNDDPTYANRVQVGFGDRAARNVPLGEPGSKKIGVILAGSVFDILEEREGAEGYRFAKGRLVWAPPEGPFNPGAELWFASHQHGQPISPDNCRLLLAKVLPPARARPAYWQGMVEARVRQFHGLDMHRAPENNEPGASYGVREQLPSGYTFRFDNAHTVLVNAPDGTRRPMARCTIAPTTIRGEPLIQAFWAYVDDIELEFPRTEPVGLDSVIVPEKPIPIKAGAPVGYLGLYETPAETGKTSKHQVHLEVFTCDPNLDAFLSNEAGLKHGKQYLHVPKLQPDIVAQDTESELRRFLFQDHVFDLNKLPVVKDKDGALAYKINVQEKVPTPKAPIRNFEALISKQGVQDGTTKAQIVSQHDFKALGFKIVEQGANSCSPLISGKVCNFYKHLHALADVNHDGNVSAEELRVTLRNPAFRNRWSKLITHHHTEWQTTADAANWQAFRDRLSHDPEWLRHESERINNLVFWDEVAEKVGLPEDGRVSYFHPVEFVGCLQNRKLHPVISINNRNIEISFLDFYDNSVIDEEDYINAATRLRCEVEAIKAVAITETGSSGSYFINGRDDKVPTILFERHYFHRLTGGRFGETHPEISQKTGGGYGRFSAQYEKLLSAYSLDPNAALKSASWGRFQIMGDNHLRAGYCTVEAFVNDMGLSERKHLEAFVNFILSDPVLSAAIIEKDWLKFARKYNGANQVGYDGRISENYELIKNAK
ncbi:N-acetylmuramidase family protein [Pseudomonas sp. 10B1]|uniref:N-acetylmuramidase family protein n=2 Tax=unclassified Pseudomonas TaxID=196821 RepID=UPI002AB3F821|nr:MULTISPECIES: N-acetylmuramidase family protein [unclassified Pseudomonas]MDY7562159.1 N-acetylmuramidase family protein [Pseudomonas sp. AB6]MEA9979563.1 N-acetylmuramidase family protein [Pseudomonas sp. RTS4]MEB0087594.1 N-acetylmuramidase family protein [Pseudomonas sp. RTI1]MEB0127684.1 N-acetylmuramidase family protein [Pseudomonas sp. CCC1.2]MEB0154514.1 N-acetylmuramidase family protein [Pseudomonas sp. CCC4.3]